MSAPNQSGPGTTRRAFLLGAAAGAGLLVARGAGARGLFAPGDAGDSYPQTLAALGRSLTPAQRAQIVFPADHPTRQIVNTIAIVERPHLGTLLSPRQQVLLRRLYTSMLSERGLDAFAGTIAVEGRLEGCVLAIYGEPEQADAQAVIMGGHLMLRGGPGAGGAALGGGVSYGHQIGNHRWRVEGNSFAYHGDAANRVFAALGPAERALAVVPSAPHELVLQPQTASGRFDGARVGALGDGGREEAARLLETIFSCFPEEQRREAQACIGANGGPEELRIAFYESHGFHADMVPWAELSAEERARRGAPYWQVWRVEGPGTVIHFQGHPHVHAYIQIVRDPARANVGEALAAIPATLEGAAMQSLLEGAMRRATGEALAYHWDEIPGRFCAGEVTTGLAYSLDPYRNRLAVAAVEGRAMAAPLRRRLEESGVAVDDTSRYRIATSDYIARQRDRFGEAESVESSDLYLRDALVEHLRAGALERGVA